MATILIVDDQLKFRRTFRNGLREAGYPYEVLEASGRGEALDVVQKREPDLIVLDLDFGEGPRKTEGFDICRQVRGFDTYGRRVPILVLTKSAGPADKTTALRECKADDYVLKTETLDVIFSHIEALLRRTARAPFQPEGESPILGLTCAENQPIHLTMGQSIRFLGSTRLHLQPPQGLNRFGHLADLGGDRWLELAKAQGEHLWQEMFVRLSEVGKNYHFELGNLKGDARLLRLRFPGPPELLRIPLEFLHDGEFLVLRHPFARSITGVKRNAPPLCAELLNRIWAERELRVLAIASNVWDDGLPKIDMVDEEIKELKAQLEKGFGRENGDILKVSVTAIPTREATYAAVERELKKREKYDLIHYAGHGIRNERDPQSLSGLPFWREPNYRGGWRLLTTQDLAVLLEGSRVGFIFLNACRTLVSGGDDARARCDFLGLADSMVHAGVPALLGHRWPISDKVAVFGAHEFYKSLARQGELDVAALDMRKEVSRGFRNDPGWLSPIIIVQR